MPAVRTNFLPPHSALSELTRLPQRHHTLPQAQTSSARAALQSFYCQLCAKGYTRMNDYESHLGSYDHTHKQRLKDMKAMVRDPAAQERARRAEAKADGLVSIRLEEAPAGAAPKKGGFKKSGFKSAFAPAHETGSKADQEKESKQEEDDCVKPAPPAGKDVVDEDHDSADDEDYEHYDPNFPTPS
jgi:hypothetical protein